NDFFFFKSGDKWSDFHNFTYSHNKFLLKINTYQY
ncbi:hypothetical protein NT04LM_1013, partial [Listeria monocytogenes FSL F2-208]